MVNTYNSRTNLRAYIRSGILSINNMTGKKIGGRKAGTSNRITSAMRETILDLCNDYSASGLMASDFAQLGAKDRLYLFEKFCQYITPKMQAVAVSGDEENPITIEERLIELSKKPEKD